MIYYNIAIRKKLLFVIFLSIFSYTVAGANNLNIIKVNAQTSTVNLFNYIDILEDKDNNLTIENIIKGRYENLFTPASVTGNSFGFSKSAYWIRFSIQIDKNVEESLYLELSYPLMDYATLYIPHKDGSFTEKKAGELIPISIKEVDHRNHLFSVPKNFNTVQTYYMYVKSDASMQVPLKLLTSSTLVEQIDKVNFILGGYYGNMVLLMIFSFIAYLKIKDKLFFSYTIYLLSYLLFQLSMNGFLYQYFFPFPLEYSNKFNALSLGFVIFGATLFSGHFLQIWEREYFKIRLLFYSLIVGAFLGVLVAFTISHSLGVKIAAIVGMLLPLVIMFGAIYSLYTGYKPARFFLIAWSIFLFGIFIAGLLVLGFVPHTFFTAYSMQIGSTLEILLLSYALIERLNIVNEEKNRAREEASRYINQINEGLESLVKERTKELEEKNKLLSELAIRDGMTGMLNHNASIEKLNTMKSAALRYGYKLAVIMLDIDLFKSINDTYGHPTGDKILLEIAKVIKKNIRKSDAAGRYGGEEFIILLHNTDEKSALELAQRIRKGIAFLKIPEINKQQVTASFGVSVFDASSPDLDIVKQADIALYNAKEAGRNRVVKYTL